VGARLVEVSPGRCVVEAEARPDLTQHHGHLHAGLLTTLADNACGFAAMTLMPEGVEPLSVEFKINFLRPARGAVAVARAEVVKPGRTLTICRAEVAMRDTAGAEVTVAAMMATMIAGGG
jgi:uncharacterized protein (TIGR00369 family)